MNYFELYEIEPSLKIDKDYVKSKFYSLAKMYHPDRFSMQSDEKQAEAIEKIALVNKAYKTLNDEFLLLDYFLKLNNSISEDEKFQLPQDFLMEMMDINEIVDDLGFEYSEEKYNQVLISFGIVEKMLRDSVELQYNKLSFREIGQEDLLSLKEYYYKMKYVLRIKENLHKFATR